MTAAAPRRRPAARALLTLALLAVVAVPAAAGGDAATIARSRLAALRDATGAPALAAAVGGGGRLLWSDAVGHADVETGTPATPTTRFRAASVSKVLTATLLARLAQRGVVDLDAPVQTYLPDVPPPPAGAAPVTLRRLAGHLGGVRHYLPADWSAGSRHYANLREAIGLFANDPLVAPPGTRYHYSTHGYTLIGAAIEAATGKPFLTALRDELVTPLGLAATGGDELTAPAIGRAALYEREDGATKVLVRDDSSYKWPGGGLVSTPEDLVAFGLAVLGDLLPPARRAEMFTPQETVAGEATGVGLGWRLGEDWRGRRVVHHAGAMDGARSVLLLYPDSGFVVAMMSNLSHSPAEAELSAQLVADAFLPPPPEAAAPPGAAPATAKATPATPAAVPEGAFTYDGTVRDEAASGSLRLAGGTGEIAVPPPLAELYRANDYPGVTTLPVVASMVHAGRRHLVLATPFGLLPMRLEPTGEGFTGELAAGRLPWRLTAKPAAAAPVASPAAAAQR